VIVASRSKEQHATGVTRIYSPEGTARKMGCLQE
jgi:hypothetical protein